MVDGSGILQFIVIRYNGIEAVGTGHGVEQFVQYSDGVGHDAGRPCLRLVVHV
jgi:hypothetical protein